MCRVCFSLAHSITLELQMNFLIGILLSIRIPFRTQCNGACIDFLQSNFCVQCLTSAMSVYLIRFLNVPPSPIPASVAQDNTEEPDTLSKKFLEVLDKRQQVSDAAEVVTRYVTSGGDQERFLAVLGNALLREDRNFHSIQMIEAAFGQWKSVLQTKVYLPDQSSILVAAARYLAAHSPTVRRQGQMFEIAFRLHHGIKLYEGIE